MDIAVWAQSSLNALSSAGLYILVALGLTLVLSIIGIINMAHGEIYMIGAYGIYSLVVVLGMNYYLAFIIAVLGVGGIGVILERIFFRPFRSEPQRALVISIGLILLLQNTVLTIAGGNPVSYHTPFSQMLKVGGILISLDRLAIMIVSIILLIALMFFIRKTRTGQAMLAISQDRDGAALQGININRLSAIAMFLGCSMAALAGAMVGALFSILPTMGSFALMKGIAIIILGGLGSIPGAVIGGLIFGLIDGIMPVLTTTYLANLVGFIAIILIMVLRPQGLWGHE
ncbi:MAG: branched-chain amino acid ABC transporter permease [Dehalococcoidales bacterium]|nr:branched-chain amino acid ABC transporter permease [Dehalococcoidales bacterium]